MQMHGLLNLESGGDLSSRAVTSQVLSTCGVLTSVFGMGTGVAPQPLPPEILNCVRFSGSLSANRVLVLSDFLVRWSLPVGPSERHGFVLRCRLYSPRAFGPSAALYLPLAALGSGSPAITTGNLKLCKVLWQPFG